MILRVSSLAALCASLWAGPALAQVDAMAMAHNSAANQLGVLEYCQSQGHIDSSAIAAEKGVISRLPAYAGSTEAAEAAGKQGMISGNGGNVPLADMASKGNTTETALCQQMASNVKQVAASNQAAFGAGGMPKMPGGMPAMPGGMPAIPGGMPAMPAMPGAPPAQ